MGFALWIKDDLAYAQGTHEYRPMGTAVIGVRNTFSPRDFSRRRHAPARMDPSLVGLFASLGEMNDWLGRRSQRLKINQRRHPKLGPPMF